jgi:hypothetical protein
MSIQNTIVEAVNRALGSQTKEVEVSTIDMAKMIQEVEGQIEGLFNRMKAAEREVAYLKDRVQAQRDTINKLQLQGDSRGNKK